MQEGIIFLKPVNCGSAEVSCVLGMVDTKPSAPDRFVSLILGMTHVLLNGGLLSKHVILGRAWVVVISSVSSSDTLLPVLWGFRAQ